MPPTAGCCVGSSNLGYVSTFYRNQLNTYNFRSPERVFMGFVYVVCACGFLSHIKQCVRFCFLGSFCKTER